MTKKLPKFLLAHNHNLGETDNYIIHTQSPNFICQVHHFNSPQEIVEFTTSIKEIFVLKEGFKIVVSYVSGFCKENELSSKTLQTLERALDWYIQTSILRPKKKLHP